MSGPHRTPYAILVGWWWEGVKKIVVKMLLHVCVYVRVVACVHMSMYDICMCDLCVHVSVHVHVCECVRMHTCMCIYVIRMYIKVRYRIAGKFGEDFNLAVWRIVKKTPN